MDSWILLDSRILLLGIAHDRQGSSLPPRPSDPLPGISPPESFNCTSVLSKKSESYGHTCCPIPTLLNPDLWILFSQDSLIHNCWVTPHSDLKSKAQDSESIHSKILRFRICLLLHPSLQTLVALPEGLHILSWDPLSVTLPEVPSS